MAGNHNSGRQNWERPWTDALRKAVYANDRKALDDMARVLVAQARSGDQGAIEHIANRLEGKPVQQIETNATIEHKYVRTPEKAADDDWKQFLAHKAAVPKANGNGISGTGNGSAY